MDMTQIFVDPADQMIFKRALYHLMEQIWREQLVDVCSWKVNGKWLKFV
jgi:hypothetical protein